MGKSAIVRIVAVLAAVAAVLLPLTAVAAADRLVISVPVEPPTLDPTASPTDATDGVVYANVFEGLTRLDQHGVPQPALAERWHVSGDGLVYTFYLRRGVRFHDDTAFDAEVAAYSLRRITEPGSSNTQRTTYQHIARAEPVGSHILRLALDYPDGTLPYKLALGAAAMVAPATAASNGRMPIGTGPFRFVRWVPGQLVELQRFDSYWGRPARLEQVVFRFIDNPLAALSDLNIGDLDAVTRLPQQLDLRGFADSGQFRIGSVATEGEVIVAFNHARAPFNDLQVRRALSHAIDRRALTESPDSRLGPPIGSHFPPQHPAYIDLTGRYPHDPELARRLLAEAGYPDGLTARLVLPPFWYARISGLVIAAQLAVVGVKLETEEVTWLDWLDRVYRRHDFDLTIVAHTEPNDIQLYADGGSYMSYDNPAFQSLMGRIARTIDTGQQYVLLQEAQRLLTEDAAALFLFQLTLRAVTDRRLEGLWENLPINVTDVTAAYWRE